MRDILIIIIFTVILLSVLVMIFGGRIIQPKYPKCGRKGTFGLTGQSRTETSTDGGYGTVYEEFGCSYCNYTDWKRMMSIK